MGAWSDFEGMTGKVITTQLPTAMPCVPADQELPKPMEHRNVIVLKGQALKLPWIMLAVASTKVNTVT